MRALVLILVVVLTVAPLPAGALHFASTRCCDSSCCPQPTPLESLPCCTGPQAPSSAVIFMPLAASAGETSHLAQVLFPAPYRFHPTLYQPAPENRGPPVCSL